MNMAQTLEHKQNVSSKLSSQAILNWPASQNTGSNSIIPTPKSIGKGGGQKIEPIGNNEKMGSSAPFIKRLTQAKMAGRRAKVADWCPKNDHSLPNSCTKNHLECSRLKLSNVGSL
ncbi:hypothetical protein J1N35_044394 [Gossypium stocksii]|uniref:Uncharacterized protein n=1 Tax=Gossypium stocksii TaxID=47602 RepID=A0A9D3U9A7_9ROSI|nr:hypothetical protein J1N35_044394 [Gossypium stocksii]